MSRRTRRDPVLVLMIVLLSLFGPGCAAGMGGEAIRPPELTANEAAGEAPCREVPDRSTPLIVDWLSHQRSDLEEVMNKGVAVVSYDCKKLELLADCSVDGDYGFLATSPKEDVIQLVGKDEVRANLPTSGIELSAGLERGSSLDLALIMVGKKRTTLASVERTRLRGDCTKATHFVRGAYLGAFSMRSGTVGKIGAAVDIFGATAAAASESQKRVARRDGAPQACEAASQGASGPTAGCGALLRLELKAVQAKSAALPGPDEAADCPRGMVAVGGKCTKPTANVAHVCASTDAADCRKQCDLGNAESCSRLAYMVHYGREGQKQDVAEAARLYQRACDGGVQNSCAGLGFLYGAGAGGLTQDVAKQVALTRRACDAGDPRGCNNLGALYLNGEGVPRDEVKARTFNEKACNGGWAMGCSNLGTLYKSGRAGLAVDWPKAASLFQKGCDANEGMACRNLANLYWQGGVGFPKDTEKAIQLYRRALPLLQAHCQGGGSGACQNLGWAYENGRGVARDDIKAAGFYRQACNGGSSNGCNDLGRMVEGGRGLPRDDVEAARLYRKACDGGTSNGCTNLGWLYENGRGVARDDKEAARLYRKAFDGGDLLGTVRLGRSYEKGRGIVADDGEAARYYRHACDQGFPLGCNNFGAMLQHGRGVARDEQEARRLYRKACDAGETLACTNLDRMK